MLCEAKCDAGGPNQLSETIGNLGLWTRLGIPTTGTSFKTHQTVRFLFGTMRHHHILFLLCHQYFPHTQEKSC